MRLVSELPLGSAAEQLDWEGICKLLVRGGREIWVELRPGALAVDASLAVSGSGLAVLLAQRSRLVLHGSCIALSNRGVCLLGRSGAGKSTLAAALLGRGYRLISDAMTALDEQHGAWRALDGWSTMKLWPSTVSHLGLEASVRGIVHSESEKLVCEAAVWSAEAVDLKAVVSVVPGSPVGFTELRRADSLIEVLKNHYLAEQGLGEVGATALSACAKLLERVPLRRLARGSGLAELDDAARSVDDWLRSA